MKQISNTLNLNALSWNNSLQVTTNIHTCQKKFKV